MLGVLTLQRPVFHVLAATWMLGVVVLERPFLSWVVFLRFDQDRSGFIDARELGEAFRAFGYSISPTLLSLLVRKFDRSGRGAGIALDNFIECCLIIKGLTDRFKEKDVSLTGSCTLSYESFMLMVLPFVSG
ncbi:hypothetical protein CBR_g8880 [Chara braunii]|nr:hypothetical protein CBR_g8880 [Chara braunii]|eukprot:GBG71463.1 hypothetical protein CBR_g8880 [Chara braunii]